MAAETELFLRRTKELWKLVTAMKNLPNLPVFELNSIDGQLKKLANNVKEDKCLNAGGKFEWVDSILVKVIFFFFLSTTPTLVQFPQVPLCLSELDDQNWKMFSPIPGSFESLSFWSWPLFRRKKKHENCQWSCETFPSFRLAGDNIWIRLRTYKFCSVFRKALGFSWTKLIYAVLQYWTDWTGS